MKFLDAQRATLAQAKADHGNNPHLGVAPWGWEDDTRFQTLVDAAAALVGGNDLAALADTPMYLVDKATGVAVQIGWEDALSLRQTMRPVGAHKTA